MMTRDIDARERSNLSCSQFQSGIGIAQKYMPCSTTAHHVAAEVACILRNRHIFSLAGVTADGEEWGSSRWMVMGLGGGHVLDWI